jgi:hypothetical protein
MKTKKTDGNRTPETKLMKRIIRGRDIDGNWHTLTIEYSSKRELVNKSLQLSLSYPVMYPVLN